MVPFIPIEGVTLEDCVKLAEQVGKEIWNKLHVPVYFYEAAAKRPDRVNLENIRRGQFEALIKEMGIVAEREPDCGGPLCHPTAGATVVGARKFLIAYNINLGTADVSIAARNRQDYSFFLGRITERQIHGGDARGPEPGAGFHQSDRLRADTHAPGLWKPYEGGGTIWECLLPEVRSSV